MECWSPVHYFFSDSTFSVVFCTLFSFRFLLLVNNTALYLYKLQNRTRFAGGRDIRWWCALRESIHVMLQLFNMLWSKSGFKEQRTRQAPIRTFGGDIFEGVIGKNKKRKHKLLNGSNFGKMKEAVFCFPLKAGVWFPVRLWLGKQRHAQGARCCMEMPDDRLHYEERLLPNAAPKWPVIGPLNAFYKSTSCANLF